MNLERNKKTHKYDSKNKTIYVQRAAIKKATVGFPFKSSRVKNESESGKGVEEVFQKGDRSEISEKKLAARAR